MNRAPGPLSPLSMDSNDSFASRYGSGSLGGTPNDSPYAGGPYGVPARSQAQPSPPASNHPSSGTDMSRPSAASSNSFNRPPSSASSVGRSSDGRMGFGGPPASRDSGRSHLKPDSEDALQRHYHVLKGYLSSSLRDEKGNIKPNKARDKLLRLSVTQFMELSTDVYDELLRREDDRTGRVQNVPRSLPPKPNFHPKRNQARQKLSTLPVERFRQLATDVFYELERRIPRFVGSELDRPNSSGSSVRAQSRGNMRPPPNGFRGPPSGPGPRPPMGPNGMGPPQPPYQSFRPASPGPGGSAPGTRPTTGGSDTSSFGARPLPKTFQSNTIVPNKSTMVEDDDSSENENDDAFGLDKALSGISSSERFSKSTSSGAGSAEDKEKIRAQEGEIAELRDKVEGLEGSMLEKEHELESLRGTISEREQELEKTRTSGLDREAGVSAERNEWYNLREELEQKHLDAQRLNLDLQRELDQLALSKSRDEQDMRSQHDEELEELRAQLVNSHRMTIGDLRAQLDNVHSQTGDLHNQLQHHQSENEELRQQLHTHEQLHQNTSNPADEHERQIHLLTAELASQEKLTNEVREEAMLYLQEMRDLSRQNDYVIEAEEKLAARVTQLEQANEIWRARYTKLKAQNKSLRASTLGLGLATHNINSSNLVRDDGGIIHDNGLVRDVDVTHFQMAIDDLLKSARQPATEPMLESVKNVVVAVQAITSAVGAGTGMEGYPTPEPSPLGSGQTEGRMVDGVGRLKARVTGTANSLITATKQHASASGLSPVALLDAAASNLTASVIELVKAVGIRASPKEELLLHSDVGDEVDEAALPGSHDHHNYLTPASASAHAVVDASDDDDELGSFYDDRLSPADPSPSHHHLPGAHSPSPSVQISSPAAPEEVKPAPLSFGLGRSNTGKKTNGWFGGWGKKASVDETAAAADVDTEGGPERGEGEYDPYR